MTEQNNMPTEHYNAKEEVMSVKDWLITMLILMIPIVNFVMMFVWAFGSNVNESKQNYFKAALIMMLVVVTFYTLVTMLFGSIFLMKL